MNQNKFWFFIERELSEITEDLKLYEGYSKYRTNLDWLSDYFS